MKYYKFFVVLLLATITRLNAVSLSSENGTIKLDLANNSFSIKGLCEKYKPYGEFTLYDGKQKKYIKLPAFKVSQNNNKILLEFDTPQFDWKLSLIPKAELLLIDSTLCNKTNKELWLEPGISLKINNTKQIKRAWDGWGTDYKFSSKHIGHKGIKGPVEKHVGASSRAFPVAALYSNKKAIFIGGVPFEPVSYEAASITPLKNNKSTVKYSIRTAILPGKTTKIKFTIGATKAEFGGKEAIVQAFYDSFPQLWAPAVGRDNPYLYGQHGQYINWWGKPDFESTRRLYIVNEWTYCPYKRSGDIVCNPKLWNYTPKGRKHRPMIHKRLINFREISNKDFTSFRKKIFLENAQKYGLMYYLTVAGTWCEIQLAQKYYADAIVKDKDVRCFLQSWSTARDHEVRVFPMGTSFAKVLQNDIKTLVKELDLPGFAFDCSYGGAYYRGPAVKKICPEEHGIPKVFL